MKKIGYFASFIVSLIIFVLLITFVIIKSGQSMLNEKTINEYVNKTNVIDLKIKNITYGNDIKLKYDIDIENKTIEDVIKILGTYNGIDNQIVEELLKNDNFIKYMQDLLYKWINDALGNDIKIDSNRLNDIVNNQEFVEDINNMFVISDNNFLYELKTTNVNSIIIIVLGFTILTGLLTFTLYYPLLFLGVPSVLTGLLFIVLNNTKDGIAKLSNNILSFSNDTINSLVNDMFNSNIGLILLMFGSILVLLFIIIKIKTHKKLEKTVRINIEDIKL